MKHRERSTGFSIAPFGGRLPVLLEVESVYDKSIGLVPESLEGFAMLDLNTKVPVF